MIEIILLIYLTRTVGNIIRAKNRKTGWYKFMVVGLWFGGEILGAITGGVIVGLSDAPQAIIYLFALAGAAIGATVSYIIAKSVPPLEPMPLLPPPPPTFH